MKNEEIVRALRCVSTAGGENACEHCSYWLERWGVYMGWCAPERAEWSVHVGIGDRSDVAVVYWMPLPEPPKEVE